MLNSRGEVVAIIRAGDEQDNHTGFAVPAARLSALSAREPYPLEKITQPSARLESRETAALAGGMAR